MPFFFLTRLVFSCTCNKLSKVKVGSSFRIEHVEMELLFQAGNNFTKNGNDKFVAP